MRNVLVLSAFVLILSTPTPAGSLAECKSGICTMKEADYRSLQDFHKRTREAFERMEARNEELQQALMQSMGNAASCRSRLPQKEI